MEFTVLTVLNASHLLVVKIEGTVYVRTIGVGKRPGGPGIIGNWIQRERIAGAPINYLVANIS